MTTTWQPSTPNALDRRLLLQLGTAMVSGGMPVFEVEEELRRVAWKIGHPLVQVTATPTAVWVSLSQGEAASLAVVKGIYRLDQSAEINSIRRELLSGSLSQAEALSRLAVVKLQKPRIPAWGSTLGALCVGAGITLIMQPGWINVIVAALCALITHFFIQMAGKSRLIATILPSIASFFVAVVVLWLAKEGYLVGPLRTLITPLAILLPGATLSTGMAELAAGSMVAGSSRFIYGSTTLLMMAAGIMAAEHLIGIPGSTVGNVRVDEIGWIAYPIGLVAIAVGMGLQESIPPHIIPWTFGNLTLTFLVQLTFQISGAPLLGCFLGALVASFNATFVDAVRPDTGRLVVFLPAFWLLVPGSLGLIGITEMGSAGADLSAISGVLGLILMIALGLLMGAALGRPFYRVARRYSAKHRHSNTA